MSLQFARPSLPDSHDPQWAAQSHNAVGRSGEGNECRAQADNNVGHGVAVRNSIIKGSRQHSNFVSAVRGHNESDGDGEAFALRSI